MDLLAATWPMAALGQIEPITSGTLDTLHWGDWAVLIGYLVLVSFLGVKLAGKQSSMEDFFRGGNKLPWYAVSASMIATIISAVTFIGVPGLAYREGGNFTYLQFGIIAGLISRLVVALVLVPAYYRYRVYSPYDFMGRELGESARSVTTALFSLLGLLAQAARVYLTAMILELVLAAPLASVEAATGVDAFAWAVLMVGLVAIAWTMLGGISTVVWTDAMLFVVFVLGGVIALGVTAAALPGGMIGGLGEVISRGSEAGKFELWNLNLQSERWHDFLTEPYTIWAAFFAVAFGNVGAYGTDQLLAQRIFCCRGKNSARAAVLGSWAGEAVVALMLLVGVGLWAFYGEFPEALSGDAAAAVADNPDNIFPVFILTQVPVGLRGLILAGVFAAAVSSLTSILAALAQTTLSAVYLPLRERARDGRAVPHAEVLGVSRGLIVAWGVALCGMAFGVDAYVEAKQAAGEDVPFLDLALGLASYVIGSLFAAFLLAWLPLKINGYGLIWAAPLSVFAVFASRSHDPTLPASFGGFIGGLSDDHAYLALMILVALILLAAWIVSALFGDPAKRNKRLLKTAWLALGGVWLAWLSAYGHFAGDIDPATGDPEKISIAWPWYAPLGGLTALLFGYLLADRRERPAHVAIDPDLDAASSQAAATPTPAGD